MKKLVIRFCDHCPYFDNVYYSYNQKCKLTNERLERKAFDKFEIPSNCPLQDTDETIQYEYVLNGE